MTLLSIWSDILVDVPVWKWVLGGGIALGLTVLRYGVGIDGPSKAWMRWGLGVVRLAVLATLCFLLLEPLLRSSTIDVEPSTIILVHDGTTSQWAGPDSTARKKALTDWYINAPKLFTESGFEVEQFTFSTQLQSRDSVSESKSQPWSANLPRTDISAALEGLLNKYSHRNIAGVVFTSDGVSNRGRDPEFGTQLLEVPHFFIGTGDTSLVRDIQVAEVIINEVAYLDNEFPLEVRLKSQGYIGEKVNLRVLVDGVMKKEVVWSPNSEVDYEKLDFYISANKVGSRKVRVEALAMEGESRPENNSKTVYVNVLESKRRVLIVAEAPHPDVAAIRSAVVSNKHQEAEVLWANDIQSLDSLPPHDILILHNIPSVNTPLPASVDEDIAKDTPILFIGGPSMDWHQLPVERTGLRMDHSNLLQTVDAEYNTGFSLFAPPEQLANRLLFWPPLNTTFGEVHSAGALDVLLDQRLGALETSWPLWAFHHDAAGRRSGVVLGDGLWRWRLEDYLRNESFETFDGLLNNSIQYLSSRDDIRRFRIEAPTRLDEDQHLRITAQAYDAALNPTTKVDIAFTLKNENQKELDYAFSVSGNHYVLNCGHLSTGKYSWISTCVLDGEVYKERGELVILKLQAELNATPADHNLLNRLSKKTGGKYLGSLGKEFRLDESKIWRDKILDGVVKRDILHEFTERIELIKIDLILWLILGGLTIEWVVRRRQGGY